MAPGVARLAVHAVMKVLASGRHYGTLQLHPWSGGVACAQMRFGRREVSHGAVQNAVSPAMTWATVRHECWIPPMNRISCALPMLLAFLLACVGHAHADGMQPESSIIILEEVDGQAEMNVRNTDAVAALLHTTVHDIPEDPDTRVVVTPPVARVEPGHDQLVRFIHHGPELKTQRLKRVVFEGIGQRLDTHGRAVVGVSVRQNLPLLLHPRGLAHHRTP